MNKQLRDALNIIFIIVFCLGGIFFISRSIAQPPDSVSLGINIPVKNPQTQTTIYSGPSEIVGGSLNNQFSTATNSCGSLGANKVLRSFAQQTQFNVFAYVDYWEYALFWGLIVGANRHVVEDWVENPPAYNLECWTNQPQVEWRASPNV